jgi:glyoxylase-like metal-dependent hydrolase (beta-lactamase superfamily II)
MSKSILVSSVLGNGQSLDGGAMFGNVPRALWERWEPVDPQGRIALKCRGLLVEADGQRILCETGIGNYMTPEMVQRFGVGDAHTNLMIDSLEKLDVAEDEIDWVILSHLHFDHAGGLMPSYGSEKRTLRFPRAKYVVGKAAWERALSPHSRDRASFIPELPEMLTASGRLVIVGDDLVAPGLNPRHFSFKTTFGHTPGQLHTVVTGNEQSVFFCGDLVPGLAWIHLAISMGYDRFPELLIDEKESVYGEISAGNWWMYFTHDQRVSAARLLRDARGKFMAGETVADWVRQPI